MLFAKNEAMTVEQIRGLRRELAALGVENIVLMIACGSGRTPEDVALIYAFIALAHESPWLSFDDVEACGVALRRSHESHLAAGGKDDPIVHTLETALRGFEIELDRMEREALS